MYFPIPTAERVQISAGPYLVVASGMKLQLIGKNAEDKPIVSSGQESVHDKYLRKPMAL